ncbi:hypothetical protein D9619_002442 [Psilocybe cf. subviscida]|uniref:Uncharacterized protein n=1 Tax=Psilocybe cf. subviscida TaxID=2480587 RepID=A0A8H5ETY4_9AGAR|nr:hypothetical protein D9619_002442 [Psilocybe cf. subviscida]
MVESFNTMTAVNRSTSSSPKLHSGAHWVAVETKTNSTTRSTSPALNQIAKVFVGISIFIAAAYGEGVVHWLALFALLMVYLVAVG